MNIRKPKKAKERNDFGKKKKREPIEIENKGKIVKNQ